MSLPQEDIKQFEEQVERELLDAIVANLKDGTIDLDRAQLLSKEFLALIPFHDKLDLIQRLGVFSEKYQEAKAIYVKYAGKIEREDSQEKVSQMSQQIQNGNIEEAIHIAKGGE
jgi:hypothetical protein